MNFLKCLSLFLFLNSAVLVADIPTYDIAEIRFNKETYFLKYESPGILLNNDFCYYSWEKEYLFEGEDLVRRILKAKRGEVFKEFHEINISSFPSCQLDSTLFLFKGKLDLEFKEQELSNVLLLNLKRGNIFGYISSSGLSNDDNLWIKDYQMELLFYLSDQEICEMCIYGIQNNFGDTEKKELKIKLEKLLKAKLNDEFQKELDLLFRKEKVIMLGFCSC